MIIENEIDLKSFYNAHYKAFVTQAFRIVKELHLAEDIVQECIVKLWKNRKEISSKNEPVTYFRKMVRNKCIDHLRRKIPANHSTELIEVADSHYDNLEFNDLSKKIDQLIDSLPEKCRQIFVLSRFEQMTYKEISNQLNISPKTVENQISRALKVFRKGLGEHFLLFF